MRPSGLEPFNLKISISRLRTRAQTTDFATPVGKGDDLSAAIGALSNHQAALTIAAFGTVFGRRMSNDGGRTPSMRDGS